MTAFAPATIFIQHFLSPLTLKDKEEINTFLLVDIHKSIRCKIPFVLLIVRSEKFVTIASLVPVQMCPAAVSMLPAGAQLTALSTQTTDPPLISPFANFLEGHGQLMRTAPGCPVPTPHTAQ